MSPPNSVKSHVDQCALDARLDPADPLSPFSISGFIAKALWVVVCIVFSRNLFFVHTILESKVVANPWTPTVNLVNSVLRPILTLSLVYVCVCFVFLALNVDVVDTCKYDWLNLWLRFDEHTIITIMPIAFVDLLFGDHSSSRL